MKRRQFIQQSSLGILGFCMPGGVFESLNGSKFSSGPWMHRFADAVGARRRFMKAMPEGLAASLETYNSWLAEKGFAPEGTGIFFGGSNPAFCFYSLIKRHRDSGLTELLVPVFQKNSEGIWQRCAVLDGFQIEAVVEAAKGLAGLDIPLRDVLLPIGTTHTGGMPSVVTASGRLTVRSVVGQNGVSTQIRVYRDGASIFEKTFESGHRLNAAPAALVHE